MSETLIDLTRERDSEELHQGPVEISVLSGWCLSLGVLSFLIVPSVQGTVPAYVAGLVSFPICLLLFRAMNMDLFGRYLRDWIIVLVVWLFFMVLSQSVILICEVKFVEGFYYISSEKNMLFRKSMFTQSLYFIACFSTFAFFRHWPNNELKNIIFLGAWVVVLYGIYEWLFFLLTGSTGDFIVNRTFDETHTASWSQTLSVAGVEMLRIKSSLGEPSFFSGMAVPFLFAAYCSRRYVLASLLLFCIVLTFSGTAYGGVGLGLVFLVLFHKGHRASAAFFLFLALVALVSFSLLFPDLYNSMVWDKINGLNTSGAERLDLDEQKAHASSLVPIGNKLFGIGFGYVYDSVFNAIRVNLGLVGIVLFFAAFLFPFVACRLYGRFSLWGIASVLVCSLYVINLAELYLPSTWALVGLAWRDWDLLRLDVSAEEDFVDEDLRRSVSERGLT